MWVNKFECGSLRYLLSLYAQMVVQVYLAGKGREWVVRVGWRAKKAALHSDELINANAVWGQGAVLWNWLNFKTRRPPLVIWEWQYLNWDKPLAPCPENTLPGILVLVQLFSPCCYYLVLICTDMYWYRTNRLPVEQLPHATHPNRLDRWDCWLLWEIVSKAVTEIHGKCRCVPSRGSCYRSVRRAPHTWYISTQPIPL